MSTELLLSKICLVTGASRGIGAAIAERFAREGAVVYANARTPGSIDAWADELSQKYGTRVLPLYFDLTDADAMKLAVLQIKKNDGKIDVLVNNAGMVSNQLLGMVSRENTRAMLETNVVALLDLLQLVATRFMMKQKSGSIINISSIVGVEGSKGQVAYSASKGAVIALTKSAAKELAPYQIRVNSVAPGMTDTERIQVTIKEQYKGMTPEIGMGRLATPLDIANACLYFASDLSAYTTGQILTVAGGGWIEKRSNASTT